MRYCSRSFQVPILICLLLLPGGAAAMLAQEAVPPVEGSPARAPTVETEASQIPDGKVIGEIAIRIQDIFDLELPEENRALFRLANRLHRRTRPWVVRQQLLFQSGDPYARRVLDETERLLRANRYLYDAQIHPVAIDGEQVDVEVAVRDVWTLSGGWGFGRSGGENTVRFSLEDGNFLGTGKDIALEHTSAVDRDTFLVRYRDPNLAGSRATLEAWWSNNSDGDLQRLDVARPFYSLDAGWAAGVLSLFDDRIDRLYARGKVADRFRHRQDRLEIYGGRSAGLVRRRTHRWTLGATYENDRFELDPGSPLPERLPSDRRLIYPWVGFERVEDDFLETRDLDQIYRTEDLELGRRISACLGFSATVWGADRNRAVFELEARDGFELSADRTLLAAFHGSGRWSGGGAENLSVGGWARLYWRDLGEHAFVGDLSAELAHALDAENQLLLGGDSGLRGYPLRFQAGDRRVLLTLEQRFYTDWHILRLVRVGAAVFVDLGRAWFAGQPTGGDPNAGWLKDVGVGLRVGSSRSGRGSMVHLDVAFPLDGDTSIRGVQWLVKSKETF